MDALYSLFQFEQSLFLLTFLKKKELFNFVISKKKDLLNRDNRVLQSSGNEKPPQFTLPPHSKPKEKPSGIVIFL